MTAGSPRWNPVPGVQPSAGQISRQDGAAMVIGVGNPLRGDDGAGLVVASLVAQSAPDGVRVIAFEREPLDLIEEMAGAQSVWLIDAVSSGAAAGTLLRFDASDEPLPAGLFGVSTHHFGLADALELARRLGRLPARVIVHGIEGASFANGPELSTQVARATGRLAALVAAEVAAC